MPGTILQMPFLDPLAGAFGPAAALHRGLIAHPYGTVCFRYILQHVQNLAVAVILRLYLSLSLCQAYFLALSFVVLLSVRDRFFSNCWYAAS